MKLPIDLSQMRFMVYAAPRPKIDFDTKQEVIKDGLAQWQVTLLMMDGEEAVQLRITVAGDPGVRQGDDVSPVGLAYNLIDRKGDTMTWWSAESLSLVPASAARPAARKAAGE